MIMVHEPCKLVQHAEIVRLRCDVMCLKGSLKLFALMYNTTRSCNVATKVGISSTSTCAIKAALNCTWSRSSAVTQQRPSVMPCPHATKRSWAGACCTMHQTATQERQLHTCQNQPRAWRSRHSLRSIAVASAPHAADKTTADSSSSEPETLGSLKRRVGRTMTRALCSHRNTDRDII